MIFRRNMLIRLMTAASVLLAVLASGIPANAQTLREREWFLDALSIPAAQQIATGQGVTVAVVDSGVDDNAAFAGRLLTGATIEYSVANQDPHMDSNGHGTAMAGLVGASGEGGAPLGIAPGVKILPIKGLPDALGVTRGIKYAAERGAKVISVSWGSSGIADPDMKDALEDAFAHDAVVVAAAGNTDQGDKEIPIPANYPGVVAVTGTDRSGSFWSGSVQGPEAVLAAPAKDIVSVVSRQAPGSDESDGTSDATAIVSGVAALLRSKYPNMNAANVINRLIRTADDKGAPGRDPQYGFGVVNPVKALTAGVPQVARNPLLPANGGSAPSSTARAAAGGRGEAGTGSGWLWIALAVVVAAGVVTAVMVSQRRKTGEVAE